MQVHEFVCADCKSDVSAYGGDPAATLCQGCLMIREAERKMECTKEMIAQMREFFNCVPPTMN
jgi:hypothetical protein